MGPDLRRTAGYPLVAHTVNYAIASVRKTAVIRPCATGADESSRVLPSASRNRVTKGYNRPRLADPEMDPRQLRNPEGVCRFQEPRIETKTHSLVIGQDIGRRCTKGQLAIGVRARLYKKARGTVVWTVRIS